MLLVCLLLGKHDVVWAQGAGVPFPASDAFGSINRPAHEVRTAEVNARLLAWAPQGVTAGKLLWLGLQLQPAPGWHTYWKNPGQSGAATTLQWQLPQGMEAGDIAWPVPTRLPFGHLANFGYDDTVLLAVPVKISPDFDAQADRAPIVLQAQWLACKTLCLPQEGRFELKLPVRQPLLDDAEAFKAQARMVPQTLPSAAFSATVEGQELVFEARGLPSAWRGKALNLYPETPGIIPAVAAGEQHWQGAVWNMRLPLDAQRSASPSVLPVVLALQVRTRHSEVASNQPGQASYRLQATVQGNWPPVQAASAPSPQLEAALAANAEQAAAQPSTPPAPASLTWWGGLALAFLGGVVLNFMPCVFPVLAIKVLGLVEQAQHPRMARVAGAAYTVGTVLSLLLLASGWLLLRAGGQQLGWGFQLQNPYMVAALAALMVLVALNLLGVFEVGQWLPTAWTQNRPRHVVADAFLSGVLAVLLASPCAAPFLGLALGFALVLPAPQALLLFGGMGLGLALPMALLSFFPAWLSRLPKPGPWMQTLRRAMVLPILATVVWLAWVLGRQSGMAAVLVLLGLLLLLAGLVWALQGQGRLRFMMATGFALALLALGIGQGGQLAAMPATPLVTSGDGVWQPWSAARVEQALQAGQPVFVDYTADWCMTCQFNKQTVLAREAFTALAAQQGVLLLRADWTRQDAVIGASLRTLGRAAVPVYAVYLPKNAGKPVLMNEILTLEAVRQALGASS
ncbi:MAG: protein-disulfide reductase DsbD family protein [Brachymonas sp.]|nr:protein-disulfide reductase DsbD family protein [Brachymonas sp.]